MPLHPTNKPVAYINITSQQYPISEQEIRSLNPNTSFPLPFVAPEPYAYVFPAPQPTVTNLQVIREIAPVLTNKGHYEQQWEVVDKFQATEHMTKAELEAGYLEALRKDAVPKVVTARQARLALNQAGLLDDITAVIAGSNDKSLQIEWEFATEIKRDWPALVALQPALGLSDLQIDELFVLAATL